jgi:membrane protein implicated in regulation of membrane protease activity
MAKRAFHVTGIGPLGKILLLALAAALVVFGFIFSVALLFVAAFLAAALWVYFWWKTRSLRRAMRNRAKGGQVVERDAVVVDQPPDRMRSYDATRRPPPE